MTQKKKFRKFLYEDEIEKVLQVCETKKFALRNKTLILVTYNHAYRAQEVCNLEWNYIDFNRNTIQIFRQKGGIDSIHPLGEMEKELLLELREKNTIKSPYVFTSTRWGSQFDPNNFHRLCRILGEECGFDFVFTPHMLRHSKGTFLAQNNIHFMKIKDFLGHAKGSSTEMYIHMAANQFKGINEMSIFQ